MDHPQDSPIRNRSSKGLLSRIALGLIERGQIQMRGDGVPSPGLSQKCIRAHMKLSIVWEDQRTLVKAKRRNLNSGRYCL